MGKPKVLLQNKQLLTVAVILLALVVVGIIAYKTGQKNGQTMGAKNSIQKVSDDIKAAESAPEGVVTPQTIFDEYKKQIAENNLEGIDKATLYINAAFAGAEIDAPEAADYAKKALEIMPQEMKQQSANRVLVDKLQKIAEGKYDEVTTPR